VRPVANLFDVATTRDADDPAGYETPYARIGPLVGASALGASVYVLDEGQSVCPYHYESDEEWIIVLDGDVSVRHPDGTDVLKPGDAAAFPIGPAGAHKVFNASEGTVRLMMLSTKEDPAYCVYPDSNKIGYWNGDRSQHVMARLGENLDYYDGESHP